MDKPNFNQDWYGMQAKVLSQSDDCVVVDYGCNGRGTRGTLCFNFYRYNESQRIDCGHVLAKNSSEHYHYIRYGIALFSYFQ